MFSPLQHARLLLVVISLISQPSWAVEKELPELLGAPVTQALTLYQRFISPVKGTRCVMSPSDSAYAQQAVRRFGVWRGSWLAADRLHRCGHDLSKYPVISTSEGPRFWDPLVPTATVP